MTTSSPLFAINNVADITTMFDPADIKLITELNDYGLLSWAPARATNTLASITKGKQYTILTNVDLDVSTFFSTTPPAPTTYAPLASPAFTGTPTAPTAANGTNTTQISTTAFVLANSITPAAVAATYATTAFVAANYVTGSYLTANYATAAYIAANYPSLSYLAANYATLAFVAATYSTPASVAAYVAANALAQNMPAEAFAVLGSTIKTETLLGSIATASSNIALTDSQLRFSAIYLDKAATLTGIKVFIRTPGVYTGDAYNGVGLYSYSGGTMTLVASSTNNSTLWTAAGNALLTVPFSSTYNAAKGLYFVALLYNNSAQTTAPTVASCIAYTNSTQATLDFTNSAKLFSTINSQSTLPSTQAMTGVLVNTIPVWSALY